MSLIEVLVSMGVLALGLLGVAALFPVGGHYLRQGEVSDRAAAIAETALNDAIARGMLDPERWLAGRPVQASQSRPTLFDRRYASFLRGVLAQRAQLLSSADPAQRSRANREINRLAGSVLIIDPLGVAETMDARPSIASGATAGVIGLFPASTNPGSSFANNVDPNNPGWAPWANIAPGFSHPDPFPGQSAIPVIESWPVRRLSVATGAAQIPMRPAAPQIAQAERMVIANDDLSVELNNYQGNPFNFTADSPSQQPWNRQGGQGATRQSRSEFSWLLTVVPTTTEARNALAGDAESHAYDVSAVVLYKRVTGDAYEGFASSDPFGHAATTLAERQVRASIGSNGVGGGRLRIFNDTGSELDSVRTTEPPTENLRSGQWVMLVGPHPDSTGTRPLLFSQWYQIVSIEDDPDPAASASLYVNGPDWPWRPLPTNNQTDPTAGIQNDLRMVIVPDVVAVHTRTLKLEPGAAWGID